MNLISGQGTTFRWNGIDFLATSVNISAGGSAAEIDITSMSSALVADRDNTGKFLVQRDWDSAFAGENDAEVSIEFFAEQWINTGNPFELVGLKRPLDLAFPSNDLGAGRGFAITGKKAVLTQMSLGVATAEYVTGNATFRLSGD